VAYRFQLLSYYLVLFVFNYLSVIVFCIMGVVPATEQHV